MALILVIDDEQVVCDMLSTILARYGYEVETAEDGASALALFAARREEIGLVLLDLSMPKMSGVEVLDQIKASAPEIPVAVMTGSPTLPRALRGLTRSSTSRFGSRNSWRRCGNFWASEDQARSPM